MRLFLAILAIVFAQLLPVVLGRFMNAAPGFMWQIAQCLLVLTGTVIALSTDEIWARLSAPHQYPIGSTIVAAMVAAILVGSVWWIFIAGKPSGKLDLVALVSLAEYPPETRIAGIRWRQPFAEVQLTIGNPTDEDYENLKLFLNTDQIITGIGQLTSVPDVTLTIFGEPIIRPEIARADGSRIVLPMTSIANSYGYEIRCPVIQSKTAMRIVLATVSGIRENNAIQDYRDPSYWLRFHQGDKAIWYGYKNHADAIYEPKSAPTFVFVEGTFEVNNFSYKVSRKVPAQDVYSEILEKYRAQQKPPPG